MQRSFVVGPSRVERGGHGTARGTHRWTPLVGGAGTALRQRNAIVQVDRPAKPTAATDRASRVDRPTLAIIIHHRHDSYGNEHDP